MIFMWEDVCKCACVKGRSEEWGGHRIMVRVRVRPTQENVLVAG